MDEYIHNDDQILKARVGHMIKFVWLKTDEHSHNEKSNSQNESKSYD